MSDHLEAENDLVALAATIKWQIRRILAHHQTFRTSTLVDRGSHMQVTYTIANVQRILTKQSVSVVDARRLPHKKEKQESDVTASSFKQLCPR